MKTTILAALLVSAVATAQTHTLTERGRPCGADLTGVVVTTPQGVGLRLGVRSRLAAVPAVLALGDVAPSPLALPGGRCQLLVTPRATMMAMTNANGDAAFNLAVPPVVPLQVYFQGVVLDVNAARRRALATDVLRLRVR